MPQLMGVTVDSRVRAVLDVMPGPSRSTCTWWNASRDLQTLLKKFGRCESSNPRDAIYALLGISSNFKHNHVLSPDYNITFEEAVQNTIWALLFGEVLDRSLYKLPTWDKTQFLDSLHDLPGNVFDWAISQRETPILVRLLTSASGSVPGGFQVSSSIKRSLHHKLSLHTLIQNDEPLNATQALMPHADLDMNCKPDIHDGNGPLHLAAVLKDYPEDAKMVKLLLQYEYVDINDPNGRGMSPLNIAVIQQNERMTKLLLQHQGIDVNHIGGGSTPLESAVDMGSASIVSTLIKDDRIDHGDVIRLIKKAVRSITDPYRPLGPLLGNQLEVVKNLLAGCSQQDGEVLSQALIRASEFGHLSLMQLLLDKGARTNGRKGPWYRYEPDDDQQNMTPLYAAVRNGHQMAARLLLKHGSEPDDLDKNLLGEVNIISEKTKTPLALAVRQAQPSIVEMLLRYGASIHRRDLHGTTPLLELFHQNSDVIRWRKTLWRSWNSLECPWDTHAIELLSLHGANISSYSYHSRKDDKTSYSWTETSISLRHAWWTRGKLAALEDQNEGLHRIEIQIEHDIKKNRSRDFLGISRSLLLLGADTEARDSRGVTLLWMAVSRDYIPLVDLLLSFGANTEAADSIYGRTPLWVAALLDFDSMIRKLIEKGAKREIRCKQGKTPLCIAAEKGCWKSVRALVELQADRHAKDSQGRTPLDLARENGHRNIEMDLIAAI